jgi:hypothetical protein
VQTNRGKDATQRPFGSETGSAEFAARSRGCADVDVLCRASATRVPGRGLATPRLRSSMWVYVSVRHRVGPLGLPVASCGGSCVSILLVASRRRCGRKQVGGSPALRMQGVSRREAAPSSGSVRVVTRSKWARACHWSRSNPASRQNRPSQRLPSPALMRNDSRSCSAAEVQSYRTPPTGHRRRP